VQHSPFGRSSFQIACCSNAIPKLDKLVLRVLQFKAHPIRLVLEEQFDVLINGLDVIKRDSNWRTLRGVQYRASIGAYDPEVKRLA